MTTETPIYDATLRDTGCDLQAIVDRPAWTLKGALARAQKAGQASTEKPGTKPTRNPAA